MITKIKILLMLMLFLCTNYGQSIENNINDISIEMDKKVCRIYIHQEMPGDTTIFSWTGINISKSINDQSVKFVFTANHVIENFLKLKNSYFIIFFTNHDGTVFSTGKLNDNNILWRNKKMDAAIIGIPKKIYSSTAVESQTIFTISTLDSIGRGKIGQDVYLLGKRWVSKDKSISIYKKGIISTFTHGFPGKENIDVYLIDKMINKGMSGGLIFDKENTGIALISGYVLEKEKKIQTSDDLTIGIPLLSIYIKLNSIIAENEDDIVQKLGYN